MKHANEAREPHSFLFLVLVDHAFLHHEEHVFRLPDILQRISRYRYNIRKLPGFQRPDFISESQQVCII